MEIFRNIAPVSPEKALEAIERAANGEGGAGFTSRECPRYYEFVKLLWHLAYDPELFERSTKLLCRYALSEKSEENRNSTRDFLKSLFYLYLSGTHAPVEERAKIIEELVDSEDQDKQGLGLSLLDAALETWHFSSIHDFGFGARSRDYGYYPRTREEIVSWYEVFIGICTHLALSDQPIAKQAKKILSDNLRGLWTKAGMFEVLENSVKQIHERQAWNEAWIAVRGIIRYDNKGFTNDISERLHRIEKLLKPNDLLERARTFALLDEQSTFDLEEDVDVDEAGAGVSAWTRTQETTREIGALVAQNPDTLEALLPELVSTDNTRLYSFGRGLADGCDDKKEFWQLLYAQLEKTPAEKRKIRIFMGFLSSCAETDPVFYNSTLDNLITDELLGEWFPFFQTTSTIDQRGVERLHKALDTGKAKIHTFGHLAWGRVHESISDDDLAELLRKILSKENGLDVVVEILKMRFHSPEEKARDYSDNLVSVARNVLSIYPLSEGRRRHSGEDYALTQISHICLKGEGGANAAKDICQHLAEAIANNRVYVFDYPSLLNILASTHPMVFLDMFVGNKDIKDYQRRRMFDYDFNNRRGNPLDNISESDLISWCDKDPESRYLMIASAMQPFEESAEAGKLVWKPIVDTIFEKAPDLGKVFESLSRAMRPTGWSGSLADILQQRLILFHDLYQHHNAEVRAWAKRQHSALQESIKRERESEESRNPDRNESFE